MTKSRFYKMFLNGCMLTHAQFFYPVNLPIMSLLETLHRQKSTVAPQLKVFYWAFVGIFFWEVMPEYVMPILTGINIFCLAKRNSSMRSPIICAFALLTRLVVFSRLFGGANGNEGLGFLSLCFDFQYIGSNALYLPLQVSIVRPRSHAYTNTNRLNSTF